MVCISPFFRHSPFTGANDEKKGGYLDCYPGLRLLRSLSLGYHSTPYRALAPRWRCVFFEKRLKIRGHFHASVL